MLSSNISFFIAIPIIKNGSRLIEKKIETYESQIFSLEKDLLEATLEYQYLTSPSSLSSKMEKHLGQKYSNLNLSQIYLSVEDFISDKKNITKISINEK